MRQFFVVAPACAALAASGLVAMAACFPDYSFLPAGAMPPDAATPDALSGGGDGATGPDATVDAAGDGPGADTGVPESATGDAPSDAVTPPWDGAPPDGMVAFQDGSFDFVVQGATVHATLDYSFEIDAAEVTVARFRAWVHSGMHLPCGGSLPCALDPRAPYHTAMFWDPLWNGLVTSPDYTGDHQSCPDLANGGFATYARSDGSAASEAVPVTCVNWAQAAAFCASEGKRLPTTTEWYYVATGGGTRLDQYPWGGMATPDCTRAITDYDDAGCGFPVPVGTAQAQISGVFDLIGSVSEWTWDAVVSDAGTIPYPPDATDYPGPAFQGDAADRGSFWIESSYNSNPSTLDSVANGGGEPQNGWPDLGFRCARTL
jgi:formylglycine-generating enzyme required for sulfatase activity